MFFNPISELESVILELSQLFSAHPEQNRFAHALIEVLGKISSEDLITEMTQESKRDLEHREHQKQHKERKAKQLEQLNTLITEKDFSNVIEQKEENINDDEEKPISGWEEMLRQLFLEENHLTELPRRKKNETLPPLLHEDKIQKIIFWWGQIKARVTAQNKEAFLRVKRLAAVTSLFKFQAFNHSTVSQFFDVSLDFIEQVTSALYMLKKNNDLCFKNFVATDADFQLIFTHPEKAEALVSALYWLNEHDILNDHNRAVIAAVSESNLHLLEIFYHHKTSDADKAIVGQAIIDSLSSFPKVNVQIKGEDADINPASTKIIQGLQVDSPTPFRVKKADLKLILSHFERIEDANFVKANILYDLLNHSDEFTPCLNVPQVMELKWLAERMKQQSNLLESLFGAERADYLKDLHGHHYAIDSLATFYLKPEHFPKIYESMRVSVRCSIVFFSHRPETYGHHITSLAIVK
ncbi:MAG TPA: hypothetical protein VHZ76_02800, partial [Gammaproteobacteria bacterium]|nr:hypothetical protein [Gammaproteobacteria bacterium]